MRDYASSLPVLLDADLYHAGWNGAINPYPGIDSRQFAMQHLRRSILKKYEGKKAADADTRALHLFLEINETCREFKPGTYSMTEAEAIAIGEAKKFLYDFFFPDVGEFILSNSRVTDGFNVGNGANIGTSDTSFLSKMGTSTMAATNPALHLLFMQAISEDRVWSDVESIRSVNRGFEIVRGSRLAFVPKTTDISRTICTEPLLNMMFQQGIASVLTQRLKQVCGIDLSKQPEKNRKLAQLGSIDGRFGTIDLSSASDSMSLSLVKDMFPREVVNSLLACRSPVTILPDGTEVPLHMVSSMGNAYTFPLQTLFFFSLVYGAYRVLDLNIERPYRLALGNLAVFGDDIIVERKAYDLTCRLLMLCGFKVNVDKSFNEGLFRESCGHDYYHGYNVRGVYIKTLSDVCDRYSVINRLNIWSAQHYVPLPYTVQSLMAGTRFLPVPFDEMDVAGIKVHSAHLRKRILSKYTGGLLYRYMSIDELTFSVQDVGNRPPKLRGWINNPSAVLLAALAGTVRAGKVVTRSSRRSFRIKKRYSSSWDYIPFARHYRAGFGEDWKIFIELNLNIH